MSELTTRKEALLYHSQGRPGKIEVVPTKACLTQIDLSLAYSPGVAEPCREIAEDPSKVFEYTATRLPLAVSPTAAPCSAWATSAPRPASR